MPSRTWLESTSPYPQRRAHLRTRHFTPRTPQRRSTKHSQPRSRPARRAPRPGSSRPGRGASLAAQRKKPDLECRSGHPGLPRRQDGSRQNLGRRSVGARCDWPGAPQGLLAAHQRVPEGQNRISGLRRPMLDRVAVYQHPSRSGIGHSIARLILDTRLSSTQRDRLPALSQERIKELA